MRQAGGPGHRDRGGRLLDAEGVGAERARPARRTRAARQDVADDVGGSEQHPGRAQVRRQHGGPARRSSSPLGRGGSRSSEPDDDAHEQHAVGPDGALLPFHQREELDSAQLVPAANRRQASRIAQAPPPPTDRRRSSYDSARPRNGRGSGHVTRGHSTGTEPSNEEEETYCCRTARSSALSRSRW